MDNLTYSYKPNTNQVHKVVDITADANAANYPKYNDIRTGQLDNNYVYDAIGNLIQDVKDTITNITWNVYGKIESITQNAKVIRYTYDASGNRIIKATTADTTYYVRDASGNVLSVYRKPAAGQINQEEVHLYGSNRLGIVTRHLVPDSSFALANSFGKIYSYKFTRGEKLFELSNHLGNVLVTLSDRVQQVKVTSDTVRHYLADIRSANDYYPFGMLMPGRKFNAGSFRYGFNGKENDNEVKGTGNQQDYGMRVYDPRLGRFLSIDPITKSYPELTPYQFASNNPIFNIDIDGLEGMGSPMVGVWSPSTRKYMIQGDVNDDMVVDASEREAWNKAMGVWLIAGGAVLTGGRAAPLLRPLFWSAVANPETAGTIGFTIFSAATGYDGPDIPGTFGDDAARSLRGVFKSPISPLGWMKKAGSQTVKFIKGSVGEKTAVIGQGMDMVKKIAEGLNNPEVFKPSREAVDAWNSLLNDYKGKIIPDEIVKKTSLFKENVDWIEGVKKAGHNIIDAGGANTSTFYNMEKLAVYGEQK
nr:RHS repeat-associated core domain-containing protein [Flavihumibacter fluminis]